MVRKIKFQNTEFLLINGAAIALKEDYENFRESYAHLCEDGLIYRHGEVIGSKKDIEILEESKHD